MASHLRKLSTDQLNRLSVDDFKKAEKIPVVVVLDNLRSQHNIGSIFRTADAFRVERLLLCGITATPPHREIHKSALGAELSMAWSYHPSTPDALRQLKAEGYLLTAVEQTANSYPLQTFEPEKGAKYALIFGNEVKGVEEEAIDLADFALEIPQFGSKHSFNVSVSAGIVLWELFRKISPWLPSAE